jgi:predicted transcriptional regulator
MAFINEPLKYRRGIIEYTYELMKIIKDTPFHIKQSYVKRTLRTNWWRFKKVTDYLERNGLIVYYKVPNKYAVVKVTSKGLEWMKKMDLLLDVIEYDALKIEASTWNHYREMEKKRMT